MSSGRDGDAVYFWARSDGHPGRLHRPPSEEQPEDFWTYCDSINSGLCRHGFLIAAKFELFHAQESEERCNLFEVYSQMCSIRFMNQDHEEYTASRFFLPFESEVDVELFCMETRSLLSFSG